MIDHLAIPCISNIATPPHIASQKNTLNTMDDSLEQPDAKPPTLTSEGMSPEDGDQASDDEGDVVLDWTKLMYVPQHRKLCSLYIQVIRPSAARPVIPRRGEKEFEPQPGGGSGLQLHVLDRSRNAMLEALRATRTISRC
jgi:tRNA-splicing endonuclease subunit Sen54